MVSFGKVVETLKPILHNGLKRRAPWQASSEISASTSVGKTRFYSHLAAAQRRSSDLDLKLKPAVSKLELPDNKLLKNKAELEGILETMNGHVEPLAHDPLAVIRWSVEQFDGKVAMSTSFGIQSSVLLHLATQVYPEIPIVWVDTGYLPKETYEYAETLKSVLNLNLIVKTNEEWSPARMEAIHGKLWEKDDAASHSLYGKLRKVVPMNKGLDEVGPLALFSGLRSVQTKARAGMKTVEFQHGRYKILPLLKMTDQDVEKYMDTFDLPQHPLQRKGYVTVGDWHSSRPVEAGEDARNTRFGGKFQECGLHVEEETESEAKDKSAAINEVKVNLGIDGQPAKDTFNSLESFKVTQVPALEATTVHEDTDMAVIMVKKVLEDGQICRKCNDVAAKMKTDDIGKWIGATLFADMANPKSEGIKLAKHFGIATAPFFLVRDLHEQNLNEEWKIVRSYLQLKKMLEAAHEKVLESKENESKRTQEEEKQQVKKHLQEMKAHLERLKLESQAAQKKLIETKEFANKKFGLSKDELASLEI